MVTAEQQITNLLAALADTAAKKPYNGQLAERRAMLQQAQQLWQCYQDGTLTVLSEAAPF